MQEEAATMSKGRSFLTQATSDNYICEEENQTYYYSNFSLFENERDESIFYEYSVFMEKVSSQLGEEWKSEANKLYKPHISSRQVFMHLLEIWLQHHPITSLQENKRNVQFTFNQSYVQEFKQRVKTEVERKSGQEMTLNAQNVAVKAVCIGFFMTSNEIWEEMFQSNAVTQQKPKHGLFDKGNKLFQDMTKTFSETFKPVMVVSEKISSVFGKKKIKTNEDVPARDCDHMGFENCFQQFQRTLSMERQVERKMSEMNLEEELELYESKLSSKQTEGKVFEEAQIPSQHKLIESVYDYVTNFLKVNSPWQVANKFVTNILDMKYVETEDGSRVKVLKPAEDFYQNLLFVWLLLENQKEEIKFEDYLMAVKSKFGDRWQDKYILATKYFFERITQDWSAIKMETQGIGNSSLRDKKIMSSLLSRIRKGMETEWDKKIKFSSKKSKSEDNLGKNSQFYHSDLKRTRNFNQY